MRNRAGVRHGRRRDGDVVDARAAAGVGRALRVVRRRLVHGRDEAAEALRRDQPQRRGVRRAPRPDFLSPST